MKKNKLSCFIAFLTSAFLISGCAGGSGMEMANNSVSYSEKNGLSYSSDISTDNISENTSSDINEDKVINQENDSNEIINGAKLIRRVNIDSETEKFDDMVSSIKETASKYNGWIQDSNMYEGIQRNQSITVRIPYEKVDSFIDNISNDGTVKSISDNTEDITLQYADIETRLKNLKTQHKRLLELLEKAENIETIISIEDRLSSVETEIDSYSIEIKNYDNLVNYSTVNINILETEHIKEDKKGFLGRVSSGLSDNLYDLKVKFVDLTVWFIIHIPNFIIYGLIIFLINKFYKFMNKKRKVKKNKKNGNEYEEQKK